MRKGKTHEDVIEKGDKLNSGCHGVKVIKPGDFVGKGGGGGGGGRKGGGEIFGRERERDLAERGAGKEKEKGVG